MSIEVALSSCLCKYSNAHILIAFSGGVDSQVLLHAINTLKNTPNSVFKKNNQSISVCHVNHGLSDNALDWENFAQQTCDLFNITLDVCRVNLKNKAQHSLEDLARQARYQAIKSLIKQKAFANTVVLTGHHSDDQTETFLLAVKRGAGVKGLSSMKTEIPFDNAMLARPLLQLTRNDIIEYAKKHHLTWIEDESNQDVSFDRNFIRHNILPEIVNKWPSFLKTVSRSAEHCQEADSLLTELAQQDLAKVKTQDNRLTVSELTTLSLARFKNVVRHYLSVNQCLMPSQVQLAQLHKQLLAEIDKTPQVKLGDHWLRRYKDEVYLTPDFKALDSICISLTPAMINLLSLARSTNESPNNIIELPDNLGRLVINQCEQRNVNNKNACVNNIQSNQLACHLSLDSDQEFKQVLNPHSTSISSKVHKEHNIVAPSSQQNIHIRFVHQNPSCLPDYRQHSTSLKKILQELNIPPWQRKRLPFLFYDNQFVGVLGYFICKKYLPINVHNQSNNNKDKTINIVWLK